MYAAITTRFLSCTNTKPARISINSKWGRQIVSRPDACSVEEEHRQAVRDYLPTVGIDNRLDFATGQLPNGDYVHVILPLN